MSPSARAFSLLARPVTRSPHHARSLHNLLRQRGPVTIQPVRFRKPPFRYGRVLRFSVQTILTAFLFYQINEYLLGLGEEDEESETDSKTASSIALATKTLQEDGEGPVVAEAEDTIEELLVQLPEKLPEDAIFIPLWWGKRKPHTFYKGTDPEWQGFVKFMQNKPRVQRIQGSLAAHIQEISSSNPSWAKYLGSPIQLTRAWLDFDFPLGPPPEYERPGLEITDDYIAITSRSQSDEHYKRIKAALWPTSITQSFAASFSMYWRLQYAKLKGYLNMKSEEDPFKPQIPSDSLDLHKMTKSPDKQGPQMDAKLDKMSDPKATDTAKPPHSTPADSASSPKSQPSTPSSSTTAPGPKILSFLPPLKNAEGEWGSAMSAFKRTLSQTWRPPNFIDRGSFLISGFVEVGGPRARIVVDVWASYNPETNVMKVMYIRPRRAAENKLVPRG